MADVSVRSLNWRQWSGMASEWERVHGLCPEASFFLSREWVECWLATFGEALNPEILEFARGGTVVGFCLLVWRTQRVRGIPLRRVYLNCAGEDDRDSTCTEYNSLLSLPEHAEPVARALGAFLKTRYWDEFLMPGVDERSTVRSLAGTLGSQEVVVQPSRYVDICRMRKDGAAFDSVLSSNTRQQIRRSQKLYEQAGGACSLRVARSVEEALEIFKRLAELHQAAWQDRGRPGAFASERFTQFHRRLIEATFGIGGTLLMEARAGEETIGALYSFLHRGRVYFYQSGFRYTTDGRLKPGLLTHYLAIRHCLEDPASTEYDFLAGDSQYKRSLARDSRALHWITVRRATPASLLFRGLRWMKRTYVQIGQRNRGGTEPAGRGGLPADLSLQDGEAGTTARGRGQG